MLKTFKSIKHMEIIQRSHFKNITNECVSSWDTQHGSMIEKMVG